MKNLTELRQKRLQSLIKEMGKYGRLIFNDHFSVILFVILGFFMFFYREQLVVLQGDHTTVLKTPLILFMGIMLGVLSTYGRPIWLMKAADRSYVYPRGAEWRRYWLKGTLLGLIIPLVLNGLLASLIFPFAATGLNWDRQFIYLWVLMQLLAVVLYHMQMFSRIFAIRTIGKNYQVILYGGLLVVSLVLLGQWGILVMIALLALAIGYYLFVCYQNRQAWLDFDYTIEVDAERTNVFYKWISFFADVPQTQVVVKRRAYLDKLVDLLTGKNPNRDYYLFLRLLFRNNTFSGIWLRLLVFIFVMLLLTENIYLIVGLGLIGFYLTLVQILPMVHYYDANPFQRIYPKNQSYLIGALQKVSVIILLIQWLAFNIATVITNGFGQTFLMISILWLVLIILMVYLYIPFWLHKQE